MSLRLGPLVEPLLKRCERTGETPSEVCRLAIAKELGVDAPEMAPGNVATLKQFAPKPRRKKSSG